MRLSGAIRVLVAVGILASAGILPANAETEQECRTWTAVGGYKVEATFVRLSFGRVYLKRKDTGAEINLPLTRLSAEDRTLAQQLAANASPTTLSNTSPPKGGTLTEKQEKLLKTEWTDDNGKKYELHASFGHKSIRSAEKRKVQRTGRIPFRLTASLYEVKMYGTRKRFSRITAGSGYVYIKDMKGEIVDKERESLGNLCPS